MLRSASTAWFPWKQVSQPYGYSSSTGRLGALMLLCILVPSGCGQKDPAGIVSATGSIFVSSSVDGAGILLDGESTGASTPDTLKQVPVGEHTVAVQLDGYSSDPASVSVTVGVGTVQSVSFTLTPAGTELARVVLLEDFSNAGCLPCVYSDSVVTDMLQLYGVGQLIGIQFHVYFPYAGDPFYLAARDENNARTAYYNVSAIGVPYVVIDGILVPSATDGTQIQQAIMSRIDTDAMLKLRATNDINGSSGVAGVEIISPAGFSAGQYTLQILVLEGDLHYDAPNGISLFNNVMRTMLPSAAGSTIQITASDTLTFSEPYAIDSGWNAANLSVVAFVQDEGTKEVLQSASSEGP